MKVDHVCTASAAFDAAAVADRWVTAGTEPPRELSARDATALAWALKDLCYASWSSDPQRVPKAAAAIRALADRKHPSHETVRNCGAEVCALAAWTEGVACLTRGEMSSAVHQLDTATMLFRDIGSAQHAAQAQVPKIAALSMLGRHREAVNCAEATQSDLLRSADVRGASKVSLNLGSLHLRCDNYADAVPHFRQAAVLFARIGDHEHSVMADIGLGDAYCAMGNTAEASHMYARARMRAEAHGLPVLAAMVEESVALLELARGQYREALAGLERARRGWRCWPMRTLNRHPRPSRSCMSSIAFARARSGTPRRAARTHLAAAGRTARPSPARADRAARTALGGAVRRHPRRRALSRRALRNRARAEPTGCIAPRTPPIRGRGRARSGTGAGRIVAPSRCRSRSAPDGELFPQARIFCGDAATLANLQAHAASADVIHLACHAHFRADNPMFSALQLSDAPLTVEATEALSLRSATVVLSACETGVGVDDSGGEMLGLVRAFMVAGAARVIANAWPIEDHVAAYRAAAMARGAARRCRRRCLRVRLPWSAAQIRASNPTMS